MKKKDKAYEQTKIQITLSEFLEIYNQSIPEVFPRASISALEEFKNIYPSLFKQGNLWSVARHRKKMIDWLFARRH